MPRREGSPQNIDYRRIFYGNDESVIEDTQKSEEYDTRPLAYVSLYYALIGKLDLVNLKLENYDSESQVAWDFLNMSNFGFLNSDLKKFLHLEKVGVFDSKMAISVHHENGRNSWLSIGYKERRIKFDFNEIDSSVRAVIQEKHSAEWQSQKTVFQDVGFDINEILDMLNNKLELVNRTGSA